ncbi:MAG: transketolase-like TK C-terminal-containing protein, partial [Jiangellaceae bacterium]
ILAKTIKGWTLGSHFEARNATHQMKKLTGEDLKIFRDRLFMEIPDSALEDVYHPPYFHPGKDSDEYAYMMERRQKLGGFLPERRVTGKPLVLPGDEVYEVAKRGSGKQAVATTMAFVRLLKDLLKDPEIGPRIVPVIPDEARTFGMDSLFPTLKIYSPHGQTYTSVDRELFLSYKEAKDGHILHEGISEAGSVASWTAAATSYATHGLPMIPIYIFYSMFGFQRTGDGLWAAADQMARGFILGATAGRTTLNGEGLQHEDGHSVLLASTNPAVVHYDPAWGYEVGHIVRDGLRRMYGEGAEDVYYYLTIYNEPYVQPAEPADLDVAGLLKGMYLYRPMEVAPGDNVPNAQLLASGVAVNWALEAQQRLADEWEVAADVWSVTSWNELRREAMAVDEWNLMHPEDEPRVPYVTERLRDAAGPVVAVSDYMRAVQDQIAQYVSAEPDRSHRWASLGTDGFGKSDTRAALRRHFKVDAQSIVVSTLTLLARRGEVSWDTVKEAHARYRLDDATATTAQEAGGET